MRIKKDSKEVSVSQFSSKMGSAGSALLLFQQTCKYSKYQGIMKNYDFQRDSSVHDVGLCSAAKHRVGVHCVGMHGVSIHCVGMHGVGCTAGACMA